MTRCGLRTAMAAAALAGGMASISTGFAQSLPSPLFSFNDNEFYQQPFVGQPNRYGCIRSCISDFAPCDPPREKQADGRCKNGG